MPRAITQSLDEFKAVARIDRNLAEKLIRATKSEDRTVQAIVERALTTYLRRYDNRQVEQVDHQAA